MYKTASRFMQRPQRLEETVTEIEPRTIDTAYEEAFLKELERRFESRRRHKQLGRRNVPATLHPHKKIAACGFV